MLNSNKIIILSPGKGCWKTKKIIRYLEIFSRNHHFKTNIIVISEIKNLIKYRTWILPTIIINGKIVARGYRPSKKKLLEVLH